MPQDCLVSKKHSETMTPLYVWTFWSILAEPVVFIHSSVCGCLSCLHCLFWITLLWTWECKYWVAAFTSFGNITQRGTAGSYNKSLPNILRNWCCFPQWLHHLRSHQGCTRGPIVPHPCEHLLFCSYCCYFIIVILMGMTWHLILAFGLYFPDDCRCSTSSYVLTGHLHVCFGGICTSSV